MRPASPASPPSPLLLVLQRLALLVAFAVGGVPTSALALARRRRAEARRRASARGIEHRAGGTADNASHRRVA